MDRDIVGEVAAEAFRAARAKAEELGYDDPFKAACVGVLAAAEGVEKMAALLEILGPEAVADIGRAIHESEVAKTLREAEDAMRGGDD